MRHPLVSWARRGAAAFLALALLGLAADVVSFGAARARPGRRRLRVRSLVLGGSRGVLLEAGRGRAVVIVASPLVRARSYLPLVRRLASSRRVVVVELPGSGGGSRLLAPWSMEDYCRWLVACLERLDVDEADLLGHSNSGPIVMLTAARSPRVSRLILVGSIGSRRPKGIARVVAARVIDSLDEPGLNLRAWWHLVYNVLVHTRNFRQQVELSGRLQCEPAARAVPVPALLAWGARDRTMPLDAARRLQAWIPQAELVVGRGSHDWLITHARHFVSQVFDCPSGKRNVGLNSVPSGRNTS